MSDSEIKKVSRSFLLTFLQSWGHSAKDKIKVLNKVFNVAGLDATFMQFKKGGKIVAGIEGKDEEVAAQLKEDLETNWCLGKFEDEAALIEKKIKKYQKVKV